MFLEKNDGCKFILNFEEILLHFFSWLWVDLLILLFTIGEIIS